MRIRFFALALLCLATLFAQRRRFSWQDSCFNNPGAPYCQGHEYAVKPQPKRDTKPKSFASNPLAETQHATPSVIEVGGIDWRFADPSADALIGLNVSELSTSPLARKLIRQLGASDTVFALDRLAISVRGNRVVAIDGAARLIGDEDEVERAAQRIAMKGELSDSARIAKELQDSSDFWAVASLNGKRCALQVKIGDRLTGDLSCDADGNIVHNTFSLEADEVQRKLSGTLTQQLSPLVKALQSLPARPAPHPNAKAVIYGLDDGPKEVK